MAEYERHLAEGTSIREHLKRDDLTAQERAYFQQMIASLPDNMDAVYQGIRPAGPTGVPTMCIVMLKAPAGSTYH